MALGVPSQIFRTAEEVFPAGALPRRWRRFGASPDRLLGGRRAVHLRTPDPAERAARPSGSPATPEQTSVPNPCPSDGLGRTVQTRDGRARSNSFGATLFAGRLALSPLSVLVAAAEKDEPEGRGRGTATVRLWRSSDPRSFASMARCLQI
jgi:hypothetical protein